MQTRRKGGLGRGLEALISGETLSGHQDAEIDAIAPNPNQPRASIDAERLEALADSIRQHGILQPLLVTHRPAGEPGPPYLLVAGERRWRAARLAGLGTVPVVVRELALRAMLELALVENLQRQDLNPLEEAEAFYQLSEQFALTQEQIAQRVGRSRAAVANTLRLRELPDAIRAAVAGATLTEGHARALLGLKDEADRLAAFHRVVDGELTVRETEGLVRTWQRPATPAAPPAKTPDAPPLAEIRAVEERLRSSLGTRVDLLDKGAGKGGRLVIHYYSDEEFDSIFRRLVDDAD